MKRLYILLPIFWLSYIPLSGMKKIKLKKSPFEKALYKDILSKKISASQAAKKGYSGQTKIDKKNIHSFSKYQRTSGLKNYLNTKSIFDKTTPSLNTEYFKNIVLNDPRLNKNFDVKIRRYGSQPFKKDSEDKYFDTSLLDVLRAQGNNWKQLFGELAKYYHPDSAKFNPNYANLRSGELFDARKVMLGTMAESQYNKQWDKNFNRSQEQSYKQGQYQKEQEHKQDQDRKEEEKRRQQQEQWDRQEQQKRQQAEQDRERYRREEWERSQRRKEQEERERRDQESRRKEQRKQEERQYNQSKKSDNWSSSRSSWSYTGPRIRVKIDVKFFWILVAAIFGIAIDAMQDYFIIELDNKQQIIINKSFDYGYKERNRSLVTERLRKLKTRQLSLDAPAAQNSIESIMQAVLKSKNIKGDSINTDAVIALIYEMEDVLKRGQFQGSQVCNDCKYDDRLAQLYLQETRRLIEGKNSNILGIVAVLDRLKEDRGFAGQFADTLKIKSLEVKSRSWWPF